MPVAAFSTKAIVIISCILLLIALGPTNALGGKIIWASPRGETDAQCGKTRDTPCDAPTAVQLARAGDTVRFMEGSYKSGAMKILSTEITLEAEEGARVTFRPKSFGSPEFDFVFLFDSADSSVIRGISFADWTITPIKITGGTLSNVRLENCAFSNNGPVLSYGPIQGGAIYAEGGFSCYKCKFSSNIVASTLTSSGGAIGISLPCNVSGFAVLIDQCEFEGNIARATTSAAATAAGGAVSLRSVARDASALNCLPFYDSPISFIVRNSTFNANFATSDLDPSSAGSSAIIGGISTGGAIYVSMDVGFSEFSIANSSFDANFVAASNGAEVGGIADGGSISISLANPTTQNVSLVDLKIINSKSTLSGSTAIVGGISSGAVSIRGAFHLFLNASTFSANEALSDIGVATGGALSLRWERHQSASIPQLNARIGHSAFDSNAARGASAAGGAIFIDHIFSNLSLDSVSITQNTARSSKYSSFGGGVAISLKNNELMTNFSKMRLHSNIVAISELRGASSVSGAGLYLQVASSSGHATIEDSEIIGNSFDYSTVSSDSSIEVAGAGVYFEGQYFSTSSKKPVEYNTSAFLEVRRTTLSDNFAPSQAGSSANQCGGALALWSPNNASFVQVLISRAEMNNNSIGCSSHFTTCSGGAIYAHDRVNITIRNSEFNSNSAVGPQYTAYAQEFVTGGAIAAKHLLTVVDSEFVFNRVRGSSTKGGAIHARAITVSHSTFQRNMASASTEGLVQGGAISIDTEFNETRFVIITSSFFSSNYAFSSVHQRSGGGAVALIDPSYYIISDCIFDNCNAPKGGAILLATGPNLNVSFVGSSKNNTYKNNVALLGSVAFLLLGASPNFSEPSLNDLCRHYAFENGNEATWGSICSSYPHHIVLRDGVPKVLWPGLEFDLSAVLLDRYNNTIAYRGASMTVHMKNSLETRNNTITIPSPDKTSSYVFRRLRVDANSSMETISFVTTIGNTDLRKDIFIPISKCPPAFQERFLRSGLAGCEPCGPGFYTLAGDMVCRACVDQEEEDSSLEEGPHETDEEAATCLSPPHSPTADEHHGAVHSSSSSSSPSSPVSKDTVDVWTIKSGFYPVPSPIRPTQLLPCLNHHACADIECALLFEEEGHNPFSSLNLNCTVNCNASDTNYACLCEHGYTDRLCSRCVCDSVENCYFSLGGEEHMCQKCTPLSSGILVAVAAFLLVSQVLFLLFKKSAIAILLAELAVTTILLFLGLAEWYLFDMVVATGLLFLVNSTAADSGSHLALSISAVKVLIYFVPTTMLVVPNTLWPAFARSLMAKINSLTLRVSGLECLSQELFSQASGRLAFVLLVPVVFASVVVAGHLIAALLGRLALIKRLQRCSCGKKKKDKFDHLSDAEDSGVDSDSPSLLQGHQRVPNNSDADERDKLLEQDDNSIQSLASEVARLIGDGAEEHSSENHQQHHHHATKASLWAQISFSLQFILFASQVELSNVVLETLRSCKHGYMRSYPWVLCSFSNNEYKALIAIAGFFLAIYVIGIPALFIGQLIYYRKRIAMQDHSIEHRIGFLYETYRLEVFWFEVAWLSRRTLLAVSISLISNGTISGGLIMIILLASLFIQRHVMPFSSKSANYLELGATGCLLLSFVMGKLIPAAKAVEASLPVVATQILLWILNIFIVVALIAAILAPALNKALTRLRSSCRKKIRARYEFSED